MPEVNVKVERKPQTGLRKSPEKVKKNNRWWIAGAVVILLLCAFSEILGDDDGASGVRSKPTATWSTSRIRQSATSLTYEELARNTERHVGDVVYYRAKVTQVQEHTYSPTTVRVNVEEGEYGWWDGNVWVNYDCSGPRLLDDDIIDLYARVVGRKKYTAVLGNSIEVPELDALIVELRE